MALKLTILLVGLIFLTLFLAGEGDGPAIGRLATAPQEKAVVPPEPVTKAPETPAPTEPAPTVATAPPPPEANRPAVAPEAAPATDGTPEQADDAPLVLPGLGVSGLSLDGGADSLSLADGVRARMAEDPSQPLRRPDVSPTPDPAPAEASVTEPGGAAGPMARVTASSVNLRAGPSTAEAVVGRVSEGDLVEVLGESIPGWSAIRDPASGSTVYMATQFLLMQPN